MPDVKVQLLEGTLTALRLEPGDVIVVQVRRLIGLGIRWEIREQVERAFPGHRVLVLDDDAALGVVKPRQAEALGLAPGGS